VLTPGSACRARLGFSGAARSLQPAPQVDSAVLHLRARPEPRVTAPDPRRFREVVLAAFGQRRKNLANALAAGLGLSPDVPEPVRRGDVDPGRRAETLSFDEFVRLAHHASRHCHA
jgi:16S rRNA (adenine1518-N6/adenine1519-N6)-dimethyltransferase